MLACQSTPLALALCMCCWRARHHALHKTGSACTLQSRAFVINIVASHCGSSSSGRNDMIGLN